MSKAALKNGVDESFLFNDLWLKNQKEFYKKNKQVLDNPRGAGYWLWKPYIILYTLKNKMHEGDVLIYIDSGTKLTGNLKPLVELALKKDIVLFYNDGHKNSTWTKRDCFFYMDCVTCPARNDAASPRVPYRSPHHSAASSVCRNSHQRD